MKRHWQGVVVVLVTLAAATAFVWGKTPAPGPARQVLVVGDKDNESAIQTESRLRTVLKRLRKEGRFQGVPALQRDMTALDFTVSEHRTFCQKQRLARGGVPYLGLVEVDAQGNCVRVLWKTHVSNVDGAVSELMGHLGRSQTGLGSTGLRPAGTNAQGYAEFVNVKDGTVLIAVPGATFTMGSSDGEGEGDERPPHSVTLRHYYIAKYDVTNAQFRRFASATGHRTAGNWQTYASRWGEQAPVVEVSWNDAVAYCRWAGLRLPTEAEWEYAARGPNSLTYPWGNDWDASRCQNSVGSNSPGKAAPVGSFPSGASPFGALDMAGNVWQWTSSTYKPYPYRSTDGREASGGTGPFVLRGGAWSFSYPPYFRGACRNGHDPDDRNSDFGWRCARTL